MPTNLIIPDNQQPQERDGYWCHLPTRIATLPGIDVWALVFAPFGADAFDRETIAEVGTMLVKLPKPQIQSMFVVGEQWVIVFAVSAGQPDYAQELASMIVRGLDATLGVPDVYR
jgi:hypothetical protein